MVDMRRFRPSIVKMMFFGLIFFISCGRDISRDLLSDIESYIDSRPDSALAAIRQIDTTALRGRATKAKYALLHAIALDKNYIDTADTRVVHPAVDYYTRHGSPEQRLKAYMYLGTEQYNAGRYNQAIVSFSQAAEFAENVGDQNLLGILYSRMADTFTRTMDHPQAASYIEKAMQCFRDCGRKDQEDIELLRKAGNLAQRRKRGEADSCFLFILADATIDMDIKNMAGMDYAMFLLSLPEPDDEGAMRLFASAIKDGAQFEDPSQLYAYAYLLNSHGEDGEAERIWSTKRAGDLKSNFQYNYWRHRKCLKEGDYEAAYKYLWSAMSVRDSILEENYEKSAASSHTFNLEVNNARRETRIKEQRGLISSLILIFALVLTIMYFLYQNTARKRRDAIEKMAIAIDNLKEQLLDKREYKPKKAKLSFLADIYEEAFRNQKDNDKANENLSAVLHRRIGNLRTDPEAQRGFEGIIDREMDMLMTKFRKDCPGLTESDYRMASYYFAGFDNTTVMVIMGISTLENTRSRKRYLRQKLSNRFGEKGSRYSFLIGGAL